MRLRALRLLLIPCLVADPCLAGMRRTSHSPSGQKEFFTTQAVVQPSWAARPIPWLKWINGNRQPARVTKSAPGKKANARGWGRRIIVAAASILVIIAAADWGVRRGENHQFQRLGRWAIARPRSDIEDLTFPVRNGKLLNLAGVAELKVRLPVSVVGRSVVIHFEDPDGRVLFSAEQRPNARTLIIPVENFPGQDAVWLRFRLTSKEDEIFPDKVVGLSNYETWTVPSDGRIDRLNGLGFLRISFKALMQKKLAGRPVAVQFSMRGPHSFTPQFFSDATPRQGVLDIPLSEPGLSSETWGKVDGLVLKDDRGKVIDEGYRIQLWLPTGDGYAASRLVQLLRDGENARFSMRQYKKAENHDGWEMKRREQEGLLIQIKQLMRKYPHAAESLLKDEGTPVKLKDYLSDLLQSPFQSQSIEPGKSRGSLSAA